MNNPMNTFNQLLNKERQFFKLASEGKRITHIAIAIPIIVVFILAGAISSQLLYIITIKNLNPSSFIKNLFELITIFGFIILFIWLWIRYFEKRPFWTIGFPSRNSIKNYLYGFLTGIMMISAIVVFMFIIGNAEFKTLNTNQISFNLILMVLAYLLGFIIQGATEEIMSRGWQMQVIGARHNPLLGLILTSIIFTLLHGLNQGISFLAIANLLLFAVLLAFYVLKSNSLWMACGWHSGWNWSMSCIYGLNVSGQTINESIFKIDFVGPNIISGGKFGPEGSIVTTVALFFSIFVLLYRKRGISSNY